MRPGRVPGIVARLRRDSPDMAKNSELISILEQVRVVPVVSPPRADLAVPLARALHAGGLGVVEVTLRTDAALESIRRIAAEVPEVVVGAGTVIRPQDVARSIRGGASSRPSRPDRKNNPGRPKISVDIEQLVCKMARENECHHRCIQASGMKEW